MLLLLTQVEHTVRQNMQKQITTTWETHAEQKAQTEHVACPQKRDITYGGCAHGQGYGESCTSMSAQARVDHSDAHMGLRQHVA